MLFQFNTIDDKIGNHHRSFSHNYYLKDIYKKYHLNRNNKKT
jgi:hypothetical protein